MSIRAEGGAGFDGSTGVGLRAHGCVRVGLACVGAAFRAHRGLSEGDDARATDVSRGGVDLLLAAEAPLRLGRVVVSPGVTAGVGWLETTGVAGGMDGHVVSERVATAGARAGAHVTVTASLTRHIALDLGVSVDAAVAPHDRFVFIARDAGCTTFVHLPGEPRAWVRGGAGVRVEWQ
jgi:hypothetical protein